MSKICIGIDQSYKNTGWSICKDDKVIEYGNIPLKHIGNNSEKRNIVNSTVEQLIVKSLSEVNQMSHKVIVIVERIRLRSQGFLNINYIQSTAALIINIVDIAKKYNINVYSVDTRSWKSNIVGSSKGKKKQILITKGKNKGKYRTITDNKTDTMDYVKNNLGIDTKGDDDVADAICISKYAFLPKNKRKLKLEH